MLQRISTNKQDFWLTTLALASLCFMLNLFSTGQLIDSALTFVGCVLGVNLACWMFTLVGYPVVWVQYKNPWCPAKFYLGYCRVCAYVFTGIALLALIFAILAATSNGASSTSFAVCYMMLGAGIGAERIRSRFVVKSAEQQQALSEQQQVAPAAVQAAQI